METLSRENRLKVPKARSVEIQKADPDNVDRLCERLQREIFQMRRRLARDMQLYIVKKDAQKNRTEPNVAATRVSWRILNLSLTLSFRIVQTLSHLPI